MSLIGRFEDCVARQIEAGMQLLGELRLEAAALQSGGATELEQRLGPKHAALAAFAALDREREELMQAAGCGRDPDAIESWLATGAGPRAAVLSGWRRLLGLAAECRHQNQVNGALIQAGLRQSRQVLTLLSGRTPEEVLPYGPPQARRPEPAAGHSLGKA